MQNDYESDYDDMQQGEGNEYDASAELEREMAEIDRQAQAQAEQVPSVEREPQSAWHDNSSEMAQRNARQAQEEARNAALAQQMNSNRETLESFKSLNNVQREQARQRTMGGFVNVASMMRIAGENGGRLPDGMIPAFDRALGYDGKTGRISGAGFAKDGSFVIGFQRGDGNGNWVDAPQTLRPQDQFALMLKTPGVYSRREAEMMSEYLQRRLGYRAQEVAVPEGWGEVGRVGVGNRTAEGGTSVNPNWLYGPQRHSRISAFGANGRGGFSQYESSDATGNMLRQRDYGGRAANAPAQWRTLSVGPDEDGVQVRRMENVETGMVVNVRDGETVDGVTRDMANAASYLRRQGVKVPDFGTAATGRGGSATGAPEGKSSQYSRFDKARYEALKDRWAATAPQVLDETTGKMVANPTADAEAHARYGQMMNAMFADGDANAKGEVDPRVKQLQDMELDRELAEATPAEVLTYQVDGGTPVTGRFKEVNGKIYTEDNRLIKGAKAYHGGTWTQGGLPPSSALASGGSDDAAARKAMAARALGLRKGGAQGAAADKPANAKGGSAVGGAQRPQPQPKPQPRAVSPAEAFRKRISDLGADYKENEDGYRYVAINGWEYLPEAEKAKFKRAYVESGDEDLDTDAVIAAQEAANAAKAAKQAERDAEATKFEEYLEKTNWTPERKVREMREHMDAWDEDNLPRRSVSDVLNVAKESVAHSTEPLRSELGSMVDKYGARMGRNLGRLSSAVGRAVDSVRDKTRPVRDKTRAVRDEVVGKIRSKAGEVVDKIRSKKRRLGSRVEDLFD